MPNENNTREETAGKTNCCGRCDGRHLLVRLSGRRMPLSGDKLPVRLPLGTQPRVVR